MRARLAFGLVVILAVGALAGWRLETPAAHQTVRKPRAQVTHSAPPTRIAAVNPMPVGGEGLAAIQESPKPKPKPAPTHTTVAPSVSDLPPELTGSGWRLAFDGEFGGSSLNTSQWDTCYPDDDQSGCTNTGSTEYEWYVPGQVSVGGGTLNLTATSASTEGDGQTYPCRSGMVTTGQSFNFQYGYVQVEAKLPISSGLWPALWLNPSNGDWPPEIDIMEHWSTYAYYGAYLHSAAGPIIENDHVDLADSTGWHTFSLLWQPNEIIWYLDGHQILTSTQYVPQQAMYFIANVANTTNGPGCNGTMQISSVKVWQQHS